jgi:hypothetical protein
MVEEAVKKKERAMSFLFTVGAKALVMSERKNSDTRKIKQSIQEEQFAKQEMVLEADTRLLKREMSLPPGLQVVKLGKENKSRTINIQFAILPTGTYGITYKSAFWGATIEFDLSTLLEPEGADTVSTAQTATDVTLDNGTKRLSLRFRSEHQKSIFLYAIAHVAHT